MSRLQFARPRPAQAEVQDQQAPVEPDQDEMGAAPHGTTETVEGLERRFADAEARFADAQTLLDRRAEELAGQLEEATRRAERAEQDLDAERLRREKEQQLRAHTNRRLEELTAAVEAAKRDLGREEARTSPCYRRERRSEGWYPDPQDGARFRYWDGEAWTDWTDDQWHHANNGPSEPSLQLEPEQAATPHSADPSVTSAGSAR